MDEFDDDEIEEAIDEVLTEMETQPKYRATYRGKRLTVVPFFSNLVERGPAFEWFQKRERAGTVIADLTEHESVGGDELSITYRTAGRNRQAAELALAEWAATVGYRRLWLADGLLELEAIASDEDTASVKCMTCGHVWSDSGQQFWSMVVGQHAFPWTCTMCGCDMPQWRLDEVRNPVKSIVGSPDWSAEEVEAWAQR
jgi:hypothetical protein